MTISVCFIQGEKCKQGLAYSLLLLFLRVLLYFYIEGKKKSSYGWHYWPHDNGRSPCGLVGMINLGATCYMASCMQQLYMMPQARAAILNSRVCSLSLIYK